MILILSPIFLFFITLLHESVSLKLYSPRNPLVDHHHENQKSKNVSTLPSDSKHLSAWELYVMNDLMFQIALKMCPKISRPTAQFLKGFIQQAIHKAPAKGNQHPDFFPEYSHILNCSEKLHAKSNNRKKQLQETVAFRKTDKGINNNLKSFNNGSVDNHIKLYFYIGPDKVDKIRRKRSTTIDKNPESEPQQNIKKDKQARRKFFHLLKDATRITMLSCPTDLRSSKHMWKMVRKQMVHWLTRDIHSLTSVAIKYFNKEGNILKQFDKCLNKLLNQQ